jgi:hypothetical protein
MSENIEDTEVDEAAARLEAELDVISDKLKAGEDLTNAEGLTLLKLIGGVNANLTISNEILYVISNQLPNMLQSLADKLLRRCGRTDKKVRKAAANICEQHVEQLWALARVRAVDVADAIRTATSEEEAE